MYVPIFYRIRVGLGIILSSNQRDHEITLSRVYRPYIYVASESRLTKWMLMCRLYCYSQTMSFLGSSCRTHIRRTRYSTTFLTKKCAGQPDQHKLSVFLTTVFSGYVSISLKMVHHLSFPLRPPDNQFRLCRPYIFLRTTIQIHVHCSNLVILLDWSSSKPLRK